jgi:DNA-binding CsgD family transcriptional regulator
MSSNSPPAYQQVQAAWRQIHSGSPGLEVDAASAVAAGRQMAQYLFHNQFMLLIDLRVMHHLFVSPGVQALLGCPPADFSLTWLYSRVHPDDADLLGKATALSARWLNKHRHAALGHAFSADYRLRHQAGHYLRVLRQNFPLDFAPDGTPTVAGSTFTDITHHKHTPDMRFHGTHPELQQWLDELVCPAAHQALTARERQVLDLVLHGQSSQQIADQLHVSVHTVNTHRRNITTKTQSRSQHALKLHLTE